VRGIHRERFPEAYDPRWNNDDADPLPTYDHAVLAKRYRDLIADEPDLTVITGCGVAAVHQSVAGERDRIDAVELEDGRQCRGSVFIDGTADGNLAALAGAAFQKGRETDGRMQSATLTFALKGFDASLLKHPNINTWGGYRSLNDELTEIYLKAKDEGATSNPKYAVYAFAYPDGKRLLFNCNEVPDVDPTVAGSVEAGRAIAEQYVHDLVAICRRHAVPLIEDDVYGDLHYGPERPVPAKAHDTGGWVLHCSSFSKTLCPGYRIGWVTPGRFEDAILRAWYPHGGLREVRERLPARRSDRAIYRRAHDLGVRADCRAPRQSDAVSLVALQGTAVGGARVLRGRGCARSRVLVCRTGGRRGSVRAPGHPRHDARGGSAKGGRRPRAGDRSGRGGHLAPAPDPRRDRRPAGQ